MSGPKPEPETTQSGTWPLGILNSASVHYNQIFLIYIIYNEINACTVSLCVISLNQIYIFLMFKKRLNKTYLKMVTSNNFM